MLYVLALHLIFVVTWFAGLFYIVRLFIYASEANEKPEPDKTILLTQLLKMQRLLWYVITWPSAILTLIFGGLVMYLKDYWPVPDWLQIKARFCTRIISLSFFLPLYLFTAEKRNFQIHFSSASVVE
jgi:putative membrane protein